ncbi:MAG TPA: hypothetical protein VF157_15875, partial [Chloroflexota bacterium]
PSAACWEFWWTKAQPASRPISASVGRTKNQLVVENSECPQDEPHVFERLGGWRAGPEHDCSRMDLGESPMRPQQPGFTEQLEIAAVLRNEDGVARYGLVPLMRVGRPFATSLEW